MTLAGMMLLRTPQTLIAQPPALQPAASTSPTLRTNNNPFEEKVLEQLNLTSDQTQKINDINAHYQSHIRTLRRSSAQVTQAYWHMLNQARSTEAQLREQNRQRQVISQQISEVRLERELAIRRVLTPDQLRQKETIMYDPKQTQKIIWQWESEHKPFKMTIPPELPRPEQ